MGALPTRNEIKAGEPQYAEPLDANFAALWNVLTGNVDDDNVNDYSLSGSKLRAGTIRPGTNNPLGTGVVEYGKLATTDGNEPVGESNIRDGAVTHIKVAPNAIDMTNLVKVANLATGGTKSGGHFFFDQMGANYPDTANSVDFHDDAYYRVGDAGHPLRLVLKPEVDAYALVIANIRISIDPTDVGATTQGITCYLASVDSDTDSGGAAITGGSVLGYSEETWAATGGGKSSYQTCIAVVPLTADTELSIGWWFRWHADQSGTKHAHVNVYNTGTNICAIVFPR